MKQLITELAEQVNQAYQDGSALHIRGGDTKTFYAHDITAQDLRLNTLQGIVDYEPTELYITAYAGTPLKVIKQELAAKQQLLAFEPPAYGESATIGGTVACALSGHARAYRGALRDSILGAEIINGKGQALRFGGQVMKNVAGYDAARLMSGAFGTLGVITQISLRVMPQPEAEVTLCFQANLQDLQSWQLDWRQRSLPLTATYLEDGKLYARFSGNSAFLGKLKRELGGENLTETEDFWQSVCEQKREAFTQAKTLWRINLAADQPDLGLPAKTLYEWGGALRWYAQSADNSLSAAELTEIVQQHNGQIQLFRGNKKLSSEPMGALEPALQQLHQRLKLAFDPKKILNPGRLYSWC